MGNIERYSGLWQAAVTLKGAVMKKPRALQKDAGGTAFISC